MSAPKVKILVCYHKVSPIIANEVLRPILLGAESGDKHIQEVLESACAKQGVTLIRDNDITQDNTIAGGGGYSHSLDSYETNLHSTNSSNRAESYQLKTHLSLLTHKEISALNPYFCELTAMYWAWKNLDVDYYGLFHYRRVFDFTPHSFFERLKQFFTPQSHIIAKYRLESTFITSYLENNHIDILIPKPLSLRQDINAYENFARGGHNIADLDKAIAYIQETYPFMSDSINQMLFTKGAKMCYWNIGIWRKEVFFAYCEWIFDVLFGIQDKIAYKSYDSHQARVFGFLAEWLFNVWLHYYRHTHTLHIKELKTELLYNKQSKFFGKVSSSDCERYYFLFVRVYKRMLPRKDDSTPPPPLICKAYIKE